MDKKLVFDMDTILGVYYIVFQVNSCISID